MVVNLCLAAEKLIVFYARDTLGLTPSLVAVVVAAGGVGGVAGALSASRLAGWIGEIRLIVMAIVAAGAALAPLSIPRAAPAPTAADPAHARGVVGASPVDGARRQGIVAGAMLGRVTSGVGVLFLAVARLGVVLAGAATSALGGDPRPVFLAAGTVTAVAAVAGWLAGLRRAGRGDDGARR